MSKRLLILTRGLIVFSAFDNFLKKNYVHYKINRLSFNFSTLKWNMRNVCRVKFKPGHLIQLKVSLYFQGCPYTDRSCRIKYDTTDA